VTVDNFTIYRLKDYMFACRNGTTDSGIVDIVLGQEVYSQAGAEVGPGYTVFDVGAHIGTFSIWAARQGAHVFCYEPGRSNYRMLSQNIELNDVDGKLHCHRVGVMDTLGDRQLHVPHVYLERCSFDEMGSFESVSCTTLEREFDKYEIDQCDLLKLHCSGAEYDAIKSFPYLDRVRQIVIRFGGDETEEQLRELLTVAGFDCEITPSSDNFYGVIFAKRLAASLEDAGDIVL